MKRSQETMEQNFVTSPLDVFTVCYQGLISSSIVIAVANEGNDESFNLCLSNQLDSWKLLKQLNEMGAREVVVELEDGTVIPFEESKPYSARFSN